MAFMDNCRLYEKMAERLWTRWPEAGRPRPVASVEKASSSWSHQAPGREPWPGPPHTCDPTHRCLPAAYLQGRLNGLKMLLLVWLSSMACTLPPSTEEGFGSHFVTPPQVFHTATLQLPVREKTPVSLVLTSKDWKALILSHWCVLNVKLAHQQLCCISI